MQREKDVAPNPQPPLLALKMEEADCKPRDASGL